MATKLEQQIKVFEESLGVLDSAITRAVIEQFHDLGTDLITYFKAFPSFLLNPFKFLDETAKLMTSLAGRVVVIPVVSAKITYVDALRKAKLHNRLIRLDDMAEGIFEMWEDAVKQVTFTSENGIITVLIGMIARFFYRFIKRFRLLSALISAPNEAAFVAAIVAYWKAGVRVFAWVVIIGLFAVTLIWFAMTVHMLMLVLNSRPILERVLFQDSKKIYVPAGKRAKQKRVNSGAGPDTSA